MTIQENLKVLTKYYASPVSKSKNKIIDESGEKKLIEALKHCLGKTIIFTDKGKNKFPIFKYSWYRLLDKEYKKMYVSQVLLGNFNSSIYLSHLCNDDNLTILDHEFFQILVEYKHKVSCQIAPDDEVMIKKKISRKEKELIFLCFEEIAHDSSKYSWPYQFFCHNSTHEQQQKKALYRLVKKIIRPLGEKFEDLINNWAWENKDILTPTLLDKINKIIDRPEEMNLCKL